MGSIVERVLSRKKLLTNTHTHTRKTMLDISLHLYVYTHAYNAELGHSFE